MIEVVLQSTAQDQLAGSLALITSIIFAFWMVYRLWTAPTTSMHEIEMRNIKQEAERKALREKHGLTGEPEPDPDPDPKPERITPPSSEPTTNSDGSDLDTELDRTHATPPERPDPDLGEYPDRTASDDDEQPSIDELPEPDELPDPDRL